MAEAHRRARSQATIAANLPYGIASLLLVGWLETEPWPPWFDRMVLMFQREVAERIVARRVRRPTAGSRFSRSGGRAPKIVMTLPPEAFTPPPKVASAVVEFVPMPNAKPQCRVTTLARVTAAAFGQTPQDAALEPQAIDGHPELLREAGIAPERRAEDLTVRSSRVWRTSSIAASTRRVEAQSSLQVAHKRRKAEKAARFKRSAVRIANEPERRSHRDLTLTIT